jgi:hypothetical protein
MNETSQLYGSVFSSQFNYEWRAWRQVCKQLAKLGVDINSQEPLASAIRLWGEELVALREQDPEYTANALSERRRVYVNHMITDDEL